MTWKPPIRNMRHREARRNMLFNNFKRLEEKQITTLKDRQGTYAIVSDKSVFVSKKYIWGNLVSCHRKALEYAQRYRLRLVMYIRDARKFYTFNAEEAYLLGQPNMRGQAEFFNFKISLGNRLEVD